MFTRLIALLALVMISAPVSAQTNGKPFGAGISLGFPTGISARYNLSGTSSVQGILGWRGGENGAVYLQADYLLHYNGLPKPDFGTLQAFYGGGGSLLLANNPGTGVHVTGGISLFLAELPLEIAFHLSPGMALLPETRFRVGTGLSVRYYF
jgi:hypothetical protein